MIDESQDTMVGEANGEDGFTTPPTITPEVAQEVARSKLQDRVDEVEANAARIEGLVQEQATVIAEKTARLAILDRQSARRKQLLFGIQWAGVEVKTPQHYMDATCPECRGTKTLGHHPKCELAAEIA